MNFWYQKIIFWYKKKIFDIKKFIFWYKKNIEYIPTSPSIVIGSLVLRLCIVVSD